ncbi:MAG: ACT domain-containing protein [Candidatus Bathyarchaeota archaeon]|nr:MAG: ACT domain-containing protein [Candidatus Bathyarchaeota archaeon]
MHPKNYTIVSFDRREEEKARKFLGELGIFSSVTFDTAEVSLVLRTEEWNQLKGRFESFREEGPYRLITFDIVLDLSIVGFLAVVSSRLAEAGISIYALSTFLRDHILVKGEEAEEAMCVLQRLVDECRKR